VKAEILSQTDHLVFPLIAVVLFVAIFLIALWRVLRPGARARYEAQARSALEDGQWAGTPDGGVSRTGLGSQGVV